MSVQRCVYQTEHRDYRDCATIVWKEKGPGYGAIAYTAPFCSASAEDREAARRIAAAWNATRDLTIEQLEALTDRTINQDDLTALGVLP